MLDYLAVELSAKNNLFSLPDWIQQNMVARPDFGFGNGKPFLSVKHCVGQDFNLPVRLSVRLLSLEEGLTHKVQNILKCLQSI